MDLVHEGGLMHPVHASLDLIIQFLYFHTVHSLWHDLVWGTNAAKITANVWDKVEFDAQQVESDLLSEYFMSFKEKLPGRRLFWSNLKNRDWFPVSFVLINIHELELSLSF